MTKITTIKKHVQILPKYRINNILTIVLIKSHLVITRISEFKF
jgi:hypothetical protein